ncbi:hypothetical protein ANN_19859 [Periplaneta americana]|uniref:Uncharacterized protein n=1 Tax=Periplaneta americana TaxID=6978 RepID=A0ABQ8SB12_PERAM|nr:hypothetical protein ANN_19859 [Periplaneta americana]
MQRGEVITILKEDVDLMSQISKLGPEHKDVIRRIVHINNLQRYVVQEVISASSSTLNLVLQVLLASVAKQNLLIRILGLTNQERELIRKYAFLPLKEKKFLFNFMQYCLMGERLGAVNRKSEKRDKESDDNNWDMVNIRTLFTDFISRASTCGGFVTQDTKEDVRKKSNSRVANSDRYVSILKPDVNAKRKNIADSKTDQDDVTDDDDDYDDLTCPEAMLSSSSNSSPNILCESVETERSNAQKKPKRSSSVSSREENSKEKNTLLSSANDIYSAKTKETNEKISLDTTQEINLPSKDRETKSILRGFRGFSSEPSSSMAWLERRMRRRTDKIVCSKTETAVSSQRNNNAERFEGESAIKNTTCNSSPKVATFETESQRKGKRNFDMSESSSTESKRPASGEKRQQDVSGKSSQQKKNIEKKVGNLNYYLWLTC